MAKEKYPNINFAQYWLFWNECHTGHNRGGTISYYCGATTCKFEKGRTLLNCSIDQFTTIMHESIHTMNIGHSSDTSIVDPYGSGTRLVSVHAWIVGVIDHIEPIYNAQRNLKGSTTSYKLPLLYQEADHIKNPSKSARCILITSIFPTPTNASQSFFPVEDDETVKDPFNIFIDAHDTSSLNVYIFKGSLNPHFLYIYNTSRNAYRIKRISINEKVSRFSLEHHFAGFIDDLEVHFKGIENLSDGVRLLVDIKKIK